MHAIAPADLTLRPFHLLDQQWALLVAGAERPLLYLQRLAKQCRSLGVDLLHYKLLLL